jgi:predicted DNA-binding protein YlxM (UPF0122 family)
MAEISQYDYMLATTPEEEPEEQQEDAFRLAASMLRESLRLIAEVFMSDASDGIILLLRFSGMSLAQIGDKRGMSKQAIHKRIVNMAHKWPQLADALISTADYDAELAGHEIRVTQTIQATNARWREATRWMNRQN